MNAYDMFMIAIGISLMISSLIMKTPDLLSSLLLKATPFFFGVYIIFYVLFLSGILILNK